MGVQNAAALPAMKTNPKVRACGFGSDVGMLIRDQFIFFTDFDGTITLQDSES